jgi:hypothetical protein
VRVQLSKQVKEALQRLVELVVADEGPEDL